MKLRCVGLLVCVLMFGLASIASADIVASVSLDYTGNTYNSAGDAVDSIPFTTVDNADGTKTTTAVWNPAYLGLVSEFNLSIHMSGLVSGQNLESFGAKYHTSGGMINDDFGIFGAINGYAGAAPTDDPPQMGGSTTPPGKSNAPSAAVYTVNFFNAAAFGINMTTGGTTGNGNGTYGDYIADWKLGETGGKADTTAQNVVGQLYLTATGPGTFSWEFVPNPGVVQILNNNLNGLGTPSDDAGTLGYPSYTGKGDSVVFVPEPSTLALLGCGLFGLLAYAWRKRK